MKTIGLIGGMSWESTLDYYRLINQGVKAALGGLHSARITMVSVDFAPIEALQHAGDWAGTADILAEAACQVQAGGADFVLICTNTMHRVADQVAAAIDIPLLHIADATGDALQQAGVSRVGLLGTAFTMEQAFYKGRLASHFGLDVRVPDAGERDDVHRIIYEELCRGVVSASSRARYLEIIDSLAASGAEAVILGCTEIGMLVKADDSAVPLYDTTELHAARAVQAALEHSASQ